jgi:hypothetical protein
MDLMSRIRRFWLSDVAFDLDLATAIAVEWTKKTGNRGDEGLQVFVRDRVRKKCKAGGRSEYIGSCGNFEPIESHGPFRFGTGGGWRNVRKGNEMS